MGVDVYVLDFLLKCRSQIGMPLGDTLLLGRQGFHIVGTRDLAETIVKRYFPRDLLNNISDGGRYAEHLFKFLGSSDVISMDISDFEGATLLHDLNEPIPPHLNGRFDCIFDGGTIEHVFDVRQAFSNVGAMLCGGGLFLLVDAANNMLGHGMYQFSPELLWTTFSESNGFKIELMQMMEAVGLPTGIPKKNPRLEGRRIEIGQTASPTYIMMAARKIADASKLTGYQSDKLPNKLEEICKSTQLAYASIFYTMDLPSIAALALGGHGFLNHAIRLPQVRVEPRLEDQ